MILTLFYRVVFEESRALEGSEGLLAAQTLHQDSTDVRVACASVSVRIQILAFQEWSTLLPCKEAQNRSKTVHKILVNS